MIKAASQNSLRSSVSSTNSDRSLKPKTNFIQRNKQNVKSYKKPDTEPNLVQINCLNDIQKQGTSSQSSIELYEEIETIETNDANFLPQGGQFEVLDDQVNIFPSEFCDRNKIRSEFSQKFSNIKKREIVPTLIDSGFSQTSDSSHSESLTRQFQTDLDSKLSSVVKHLEALKSYEDKLVPKLLEKRFESNSEFESDRLKHLESLQENQFKLMSQLIDKLRPLNAPETDLNLTKEPKVKSIQFNDTVEVLEPKKRSKSRSRSKSKNDKTKKAPSSCEVCVRKKSRSKSPVKSRSPIKNEKKFLEELIDVIPQSPDVSFAKTEEKPSLFDEFLNRKNSQNLSDILKQSNELLSELERQEEVNRRMKEEYSLKSKASMFDDIKQVLKRVEVSRNKIDSLVDELNRKKKAKMVDLYSHDFEENEESKIKKLVDGCISAISNDVKKVVNQKMIDDSKHIKLEAERDPASKRPSRLSSQKIINNQPGPKPKQVSDVYKYLGKIYGKGVLDQIKMDEIEEKNRRLREEAEMRKRKFEGEKAKKNPPSNPKPQAKPSKVRPPEKLVSRPAFISMPVQAYPENNMKNFSTQKIVHRADNVGTITILPRENSPKASNMAKQVLPSMSINPARSSSLEKKVNFKQIEIKVQEEEECRNGSEEEEESGVGINVVGARLEEKEQIKEEVPLPVPGDLSADMQKFLIDRSLSENRVLDWLEQEILKNFLLRLQLDQESDDENVAENFRLLVDVGEEIDPDLIECLTREVLNEKIAAMIDRQNEELPAEIVDQPPVASLRKSLEFLEKKKEKPEFIEVSTPKVTPPQSPIPFKNSEPEPVRKEPEIQLIQLINDEESESVLEVTLEESENEADLDQIISSKSIMIPPTPRETPQPSPEPPETPSLSEKTPPPPQIHQPSPAPQPRPVLIDSSIQCDPEPKPVIIEKIIEQPKVVESESELTKSTTTLSTTDTSTTIESDKTKSESDSYFSDGAWLLSKSEGEIVRFNNNDYVNLDLQAATKGMILNPRLKKQSDLASNSDGEIQIDKLNSDNIRSYAGMKARSGVNVISVEKEKGEVGSGSRRGSEKSEGEVMNPAIELMNKKNDLINQSLAHKSKSKKIVSLSVSPEKKNAKNNIKIKPIVNEVLVRDSNDFERKIIASTPDTSLFLSNQLASSNQILNDSDLQNDNSNLKKSSQKNSILISTNFSSTKLEDDDDDTLNNTSDLDEH